MDREQAEREAFRGRLGDGWIFMYHPDLENSYSKVTIAGFESSYRGKGWKQATDLLDDAGYPASLRDEEDPAVTPGQGARVASTAVGGNNKTEDDGAKE